MKDNIKQDYKLMKNEEPKILKMILQFIKTESFRYLVCRRILENHNFKLLRVYMNSLSKKRGVDIPKDVIFGAGSVVTSDVEDHAVVVGIPGKVVKYNEKNCYDLYFEQIDNAKYSRGNV